MSKKPILEENQGLTVAKYLLEFERGGAFAASLEVGIDEIAVETIAYYAGVEQRAGMSWRSPSTKSSK